MRLDQWLALFATLALLGGYGTLAYFVAPIAGPDAQLGLFLIGIVVAIGATFTASIGAITA